ncbi:hypothetical protein A0H81_04486 [Grifola frondosa]|uniref:Uncharacterized protein n=1 Tax=Grifola frondosa TaxID=5627 RepID=A0A1C7MFD7_GRIFR|nr:hypothetical protein A0H81_04486 [Grifola frondosa]
MSNIVTVLSMMQTTQIILMLYYQYIDQPPASSEDELPEDLGVPTDPPLEELLLTQQFVDVLKSATFDGQNLDPEDIQQLHKPLQMPLDLNADLDLHLAVELFLAVGNTSQETYSTVHAALLHHHPDDNISTYEQMQQHVAELSGIVPEGNKRVPHRTFLSFPLGFQLQALWQCPESAAALKYHLQVTCKLLEWLYNDPNQPLPFLDFFFFGNDYIHAFQEGKISDDDMILMFSMDGAQLYARKQSDCWIFIWVLFDLAPGSHYKKKYVLPGGIIGGLNKPKNVDSFLFPSLYHVSVLQREGLHIWDASLDQLFTSNPFMTLATANGPGMAYLSGLVGHHGANGCRLYCGLKGRHKPGGTHYYPVLLKLLNYTVLGSDHSDISLHTSHLDLPAETSLQHYERNLHYVMNSPNEAHGLQSTKILGLPGMFGADLMHLILLNLPDLFLGLWHGTLYYEKTDNKHTWNWTILIGKTWQAHGKLVVDATHYLPGSFDWPPRNPAEKIFSGYKA